MPIQKIISFLSDPDIENDVSGIEVTNQFRLNQMFSELFENSDRDCDIPIRFLPNSEGDQENPIRELVIQILETNSFESCKSLALKLHEVSTYRSGLGLFFVVIGSNGENKKILLSRFPADNGIVAESGSDGTLDVQFIEKVFMKNAHSYKAAIYEGTSSYSDFWDGYATDKQVNISNRLISNYWIKKFLHSDFKTNSHFGTRRFALALVNSIRETQNLNTKHQLVSATNLISGLNNQVISIRQIGERMGFNEEARELLRKFSKSDDLWNETFRFDSAVFKDNARFKTIQLDNGSILTAETENFDNCFEVTHDADQVVYSTKGRVIDEKIRQIS